MAFGKFYPDTELLQMLKKKVIIGFFLSLKVQIFIISSKKEFSTCLPIMYILGDYLKNGKFCYFSSNVKTQCNILNITALCNLSDWYVSNDCLVSNIANGCQQMWIRP